MRVFPIYANLICLLFGLFTCFGCSTATTSNAADDVKDDLAGLGVAYHAYHDLNGYGPATADDLRNMIDDAAKQKDFAQSTAYKRLSSGEFVLNPRLKFRDLGDLSQVAILYQKQAPNSGGWVVLADASTTELTAAEFAALNNGDDARATADQ